MGELAQLPSRLPEGLGEIGMGLGSDGKPLIEIAKNLPGSTNQSNAGQGAPSGASGSQGMGSQGMGSQGMGSSGGMPPPTSMGAGPMGGLSGGPPMQDSYQDRPPMNDMGSRGAPSGYSTTTAL